MPSAKLVLFSLLGLFCVGFCLAWGSELSRRRQWGWPGWFHTLAGAVINFFDALGIGSFATTTTLYRATKAIPDEHLPGTLNVGHCLPTFAQAFLFAGIVEIDQTTLVTLIVAAVLGAWLGAGVVTRLSRPKIQFGMGAALLAAAALLVAKIYEAFPSGGQALGLSGAWLVGAAAACFLFGALMTIGVGAYAPIMIMVSLLGMNELTAWPIMMGACAFLMPVCGLRFVRAGAYNPRASLGLALGGVGGVFVAKYVIQKLPLTVVRWLVLAVVVYAGVGLLRAALRPAEEREAASETGTMALLP